MNTNLQYAQHSTKFESLCAGGENPAREVNVVECSAKCNFVFIFCILYFVMVRDFKVVSTNQW